MVFERAPSPARPLDPATAQPLVARRRRWRHRQILPLLICGARARVRALSAVQCVRFDNYIIYAHMIVFPQWILYGRIWIVKLSGGRSSQDYGGCELDIGGKQNVNCFSSKSPFQIWACSTHYLKTMSNYVTSLIMIVAYESPVHFVNYFFYLNSKKKIFFIK